MERGKLISIEGIDGSGKSSMANALILSEWVPGIVFFDKKDLSFIKNGFVKEQLSSIKKALWDYSKSEDISVMGDHHWLCLLASWYAAVGKQIETDYLRNGKSVVIDGWYYKYIARFCLKKEYDQVTLRTIFGNILEPDISILLDIDPYTAYSRKKKDALIASSESGKLDGYAGKQSESFVKYQTDVADVYGQLAKERSWLVLDNNLGSINSNLKAIRSNMNL
ncbi:dTMP kinase [Pseudoalteromonas maricaloris]|uniref:dTMP kinase n=1 Tax=Pseudoalteromonas maricaloris TaxID=184924 RepID=UPI003C17FB53